MDTHNEKSLKRWVLAAPLIFSLHFLEEAPGFVDWANSYVDQDISQGFFLGVNFFVLLVTVAVALVMFFSRSSLSAAVMIVWLGFIMLANGVLHVTAGILERGYVPGLITAIFLYIPYFVLLIIQLVNRKYISVRTAIILTLIGSVPMGIHGYMIFFLGSRLW